MKRKLNIAIVTLCSIFFTASAWAENDEIARLLNTQQTSSAPKQQDDQLSTFITDNINDYTALLVTDPLEGLLEGEGVFENDGVRQSVVTAAFNYLNIPYKYGGQNQSTGFDCSGLVMTIYRQVANKSLPRTTALQAAATTTIKRSELAPGDLVFFNTIGRKFSHVGIYVGDNQFIHAPRTGAQVRIDSINNTYWNKRFTGARRVVSH